MSTADGIVVRNNTAANQFEAEIDGQVALAAYGRMESDTIVFTHTEVPDAFEGRGIGSKLARAALDYARSEQLKVVPLCPFIASYIRRHKEDQDLIHPDFRDQVLRD
jgi:uncharacterized protein